MHSVCDVFRVPLKFTFLHGMMQNFEMAGEWRGEVGYVLSGVLFCSFLTGLNSWISFSNCDILLQI